MPIGQEPIGFTCVNATLASRPEPSQVWEKRVGSESPPHVGLRRAFVLGAPAAQAPAVACRERSADLLPPCFLGDLCARSLPPNTALCPRFRTNARYFGLAQHRNGRAPISR